MLSREFGYSEDVSQVVNSAGDWIMCFEAKFNLCLIDRVVLVLLVTD